MQYKDRIKNLVDLYPHLSRVWIKTGDARLPLKSVWMDESKFHAVVNDCRCHAAHEGEAAECAEGHLALLSFHAA